MLEMRHELGRTQESLQVRCSLHGCMCTRAHSCSCLLLAILPSLLMVEMRHELGRTQESLQAQVLIHTIACLPFSPVVEMRHESGGSQKSLQMRHALRAKLQDLITAPHTPNTANDKSSKGKGTGHKQTRPRQLAAYPRMGIIPRV
ncbi:unnamed protein product [Closterium sp. Naga37s-1]|nr:unnamed protein product [Closterium sp. Naga37s-1]